MKYVSGKKSKLNGCSAAILLGLSLPLLTGCGSNNSELTSDAADHTSGQTQSENHSGMHHGDGSGHEMHGEAGHHNKGSQNMMVDTVMATVISVDAENRQLVLDHGALSNIGMDAMTMGFQLDDGVSIAGIKENDKVQATIGMKSGKGLLITEIKAVK